MPGVVRIGTSGWSYDHWAGCFYPDGLKSSERLAYYASRLSTVEINATFYRMPSEAMVRAWHDHTPAGFRFAVKGSRFVTHFRKLQDAGQSVRAFTERMRLLGEKLDVMLWQLPPDVQIDVGLLDAFLSELPSDVRQAIEFRHESWLAEETYEVLRTHDVAHVQVSSDRMPVDFTTTAPFVYVRFHGLAGYHGAYVEPALLQWVDFLSEQSNAGRDAYVYFNNDAGGHAPADAVRLRDMLAARGA